VGMAIDSKLLSKAYRSPQSLSFEEALKLARELLFVEVGGRGSHRVFRHPKADRIRSKFPHPLNLQRGSDGKSAKAYQVRQMLKIAKALGVITSTAK
ncbi:MAG TPA: type II toxin-antitoxin system HicA family toxin, partial [Candidatus Binataceae bacterium]|nr:type II toxin-antitoxin system HicA family toxin [Candidatus Binataceae bacterium]